LNPFEGWVVFDGPEADDLADNASRQNDLLWVDKLCAEILSSYSQEMEDAHEEPSPMVTAAWEAALVAYARAFVGGVRRGALTSEDIESWGSETADFHKRFIDIRNKHVAHSVNDMEQAVVLAQLNESSGRIRLGPVVTIVRFPGRSDVSKLAELAGKAMSALDAKMDDLQSAAEAAARSRAEELKKRPSIVGIPVGFGEEPGKKRGKFPPQ
jgi:hypothetical protein